jgi:tetratricopeptide (TPR) repeat protein
MLLLSVSYTYGQTESYETLLDLGEKELQKKQYKEAVIYYNQAVAIQEDLPKAHLLKIECAIRLKDISTYKEALTALEKINYSIPTNWYLILAQIAQDKRQYSQALEILNKAQKNTPFNRDLLLQKVAVFEATHRSAEKIALLNQLYLQNNKDPLVVYKLADSYFYNKPQKSITLFKQLLHEKEYTNIALLSLGQLYTNQYKSTREDAALKSAYNYYKLYANSHPKDATIKKLMKELGTIATP